MSLKPYRPNGKPKLGYKKPVRGHMLVNFSRPSCFSVENADVLTVKNIHAPLCISLIFKRIYYNGNSAGFTRIDLFIL